MTNPLRMVEVGVAYTDHTWQTHIVWISSATPPDKIEETAINAALKGINNGVAGAFIQHYSEDDFDPDDDETDPSTESDEDRLDRFFTELERRQEDGEPLTCMSCNAAIQPGESADPCFVCGQPLCFYCSTSGPRCRGCADLP